MSAVLVLPSGYSPHRPQERLAPYSLSPTSDNSQRRRRRRKPIREMEDETKKPDMGEDLRSVHCARGFETRRDDETWYGRRLAERALCARIRNETRRRNLIWEKTLAERAFVRADSHFATSTL